MATPPRLIVIGGGNMATAILSGAEEAGVLAREQVWVAEADPSRREAIEEFCGRVFPSGSEALRAEGEAAPAGQADGSSPAQILLAVKPQSLEGVAADLRSRGPLGRGRTVISILAGVTRRGLSAALGPDVRCVRVMPNTPVRIRQGISAIAIAPDLSSDALSLAATLFGALGEVVQVNESLMNAFTAVAGSGPAYLFRTAEALAAAAEEVGFEPAVAERISRATICGSAALLKASGQSAAELRRAVTSKGGTTEAALEALDAAGFQAALREAVRAARDRGNELSR